ncbi:MAG: ABC transporter ATP-binding protein [Myxococcota bacterium]|nr:ABC transporter ATP-binding protein [Myxococcota bacterium]
MSLHVEHDPEKPLIRLSGVEKTFGLDGVPVHALRGIDLSVARGEFAAVMGPSGSGKSTLLHILGLIDAEYDGSYDFDGQLMSGRDADDLSMLRNREIGFVFQQFHLLPQLTILENAALPALYARDRGPEACEALARRRLEEVGLAHRLDHRPSELSSGQRQRAAIARALVNEPRLILADEPTGALDSKNAQEIMDLFLHLHRAGSTIVLITHDLDVASATERIIHIRDGQTIDGLL